MWGNFLVRRNSFGSSSVTFGHCKDATSCWMVLGGGRVGWWGVVFGFDHIWQSHRGLRTFEKWPPTSVHLPTVSISLLFNVPAMDNGGKIKSSLARTEPLKGVLSPLLAGTYYIHKYIQIYIQIYTQIYTNISFGTLLLDVKKTPSGRCQMRRCIIYL